MGIVIASRCDLHFSHKTAPGDLYICYSFFKERKASAGMDPLRGYALVLNEAK
jgi:hypothetical protein